MQHLRSERRAEQSLSLGVALPERRVASLILFAWPRGGLILGNIALDGLIVAEELGDTQRSGIIDYSGARHRRLVC